MTWQKGPRKTTSAFVAAAALMLAAFDFPGNGQPYPGRSAGPQTAPAVGGLAPEAVCRNGADTVAVYLVRDPADQKLRAYAYARKDPGSERTTNFRATELATSNETEGLRYLGESFDLLVSLPTGASNPPADGTYPASLSATLPSVDAQGTADSLQSEPLSCVFGTAR